MWQGRGKGGQWGRSPISEVQEIGLRPHCPLPTVPFHFPRPAKSIGLSWHTSSSNNPVTNLYARNTLTFYGVDLNETFLPCNCSSPYCRSRAGVGTISIHRRAIERDHIGSAGR